MNEDDWMDCVDGKYFDIDGRPVTFRQHLAGEKWQLVDEAAGYRISTVFLGLNHAYGDYTPLIFETMCFGEGEYDQWQESYATKAEAESGHLRAIRMTTLEGTDK